MDTTRTASRRHTAMRRILTRAQGKAVTTDPRELAILDVEAALRQVDGLDPRELDGTLNMLRHPRPLDPGPGDDYGMLHATVTAAGALTLAGWSLDDAVEILDAILHP